MKTFVVRLFVPSEVEPHALAGDVRGIVEDVASGRRSSFGGSRELLTFLTAKPGSVPVETADGREAAAEASRG